MYKKQHQHFCHMMLTLTPVLTKHICQTTHVWFQTYGVNRLISPLLIHAYTRFLHVLEKGLVWVVKGSSMSMTTSLCLRGGTKVSINLFMCCVQVNAKQETQNCPRSNVVQLAICWSALNLNVVCWSDNVICCLIFCICCLFFLNMCGLFLWYLVENIFTCSNMLSHFCHIMVVIYLIMCCLIVVQQIVRTLGLQRYHVLCKLLCYIRNLLCTTCEKLFVFQMQWQNSGTGK